MRVVTEKRDTVALLYARDGQRRAKLPAALGEFRIGEAFRAADDAFLAAVQICRAVQTPKRS
jgi:hypothetical protein